MFKKYLKYILIFFSAVIGLTIPSNPKQNLSFPVKSKYLISSYYGYRNLNYYHFHNGIDIPLTPGSPIYPLTNGKVTFIGYKSGYGNSLIIEYQNGYKSLYGHISEIFLVKKGDFVNSNQIVAYVGSKYLNNR